MTAPDDTLPPAAADDTGPHVLHQCLYCGTVGGCPACTLAIDDCLDDDEPERTWPIIGSAT